MVLGQLATLTVIMDVETRCDLLFQPNLLQTLSIQHSSVQSGLGRLAYIKASCGTGRFQYNLANVVSQSGQACVFCILGKALLCQCNRFFILNPFKASNEVTMANIMEEKVSSDSPSSQKILALSTKPFREAACYTLLCFCCLLS